MEVKEYGESGKLTGKIVYNYDLNGRCVDQTSYNYNDYSGLTRKKNAKLETGTASISYDAKEVFRYDQSGKLLEEVSYNKIGNIEKNTTYNYDREGRMVEEVFRQAKSRVQDFRSSVAVELRKLGNSKMSLLEIVKSIKVSTYQRTTLSYHLNDTGDILQVTRSQWDSTGSLLDKEIDIFDDFGHVVRKLSFDSYSITARYEDVNTYDSEGNEIESHMQNGAFSHRMKYDRFGILLESTTIYAPAESYRRETKYEYEYEYYTE